MTTRINQNPATQYVSNRAVGESKAGQTARSESAPSATSDKVSLSPQADRLNRLADIAAASPDVDTSRVEAIRSAIANGEYSIDADSLANNMLTADRLLGR